MFQYINDESFPPLSPEPTKDCRDLKYKGVYYGKIRSYHVTYEEVNKDLEPYGLHFYKVIVSVELYFNDGTSIIIPYDEWQKDVELLENKVKEC